MILTIAATAPAAAEEDSSDEGYMAMARHSFYSARTAEGKSEAEVFPPDAHPEMELEGHPSGLAKHAGPEHRPIPAAPIVRKLAREIGVDIYLVKGTGPGGRISQDDVKAFARGAFARMADAESSVRVAVRAGAVVEKLPDFVLRSSDYRRSRCGALSALDRGRAGTALPAFGAGIGVSQLCTGIAVATRSQRQSFRYGIWKRDMSNTNLKVAVIGGGPGGYAAAFLGGDAALLGTPACIKLSGWIPARASDPEFAGWKRLNLAR